MTDEFVTISSILIVLFTRVTCQTTENHCTSDGAIANFDMGKFLGKWYVVKESVPSFTCTTHAIAKSNDSIYIDNVINFPTEATSISHIERDSKVIYSLKPTNNSAWMKKNSTWELDPGNVIIFATDYDNYAGIYLCNTKQLEFMGYIGMIEIYSRKKTLEKKFLEEVDEKMRQLDIMPEKIFDVDHGLCNEYNDQSFQASIDKVISQAAVR